MKIRVIKPELSFGCYNVGDEFEVITKHFLGVWVKCDETGVPLYYINHHEYEVIE